MKKFFFSLAAIAAIVAGCTKEIIEEPVSPVDGTYTIKASIADETKTSIDDEGKMAWIAGDQIGVYDGEFHTFTLKDGATADEAIFNGELTNPGAAVLAVCPYGIGDEVADKMISFNLPSQYAYDGQSTHAFMIASGFKVNDKTATIKFKHIGGLFKVTYNNVPEEAATFCFEATKQIAGEFYIEDYTVTDAAIAVEESETGRTVSYSIASTDDHSSMSFYVPVPVGTFGFNISLKDEGGNKIAKSSKTKSTFKIVKGDYVDIPAINMPRKWVEEFACSNVNSNAYNTNSQITTSGYKDDFDYSWTSGGDVYVFKNGIKLGKSGGNGSVTNEGDKEILSDVPTGTIFTIRVYAARWKGDAGSIVATYNGKVSEPKPAANGDLEDNNAEYSQDDFTLPTEFVFQKAEGVNSFTIASTEKRLLIDKIEIVEGGVLPEPFSVSTESLTPAWDDTEATFDITAGDKVNWTIGAVEGLTFSKSSGNGNATIIVSFAQNEEETQLQKEILVSTNYESVEGEKEYTISFTQAGKPAIELDGDGSVENPYSVADALYICGNLDSDESTAENYYVAGPIFSVGTLSSGSLTYYIGTSDESKIQIYKGKDLGNSNFSATSDLSVGNDVVVNGKIFNYQGTTPEINTPNYIYSINGHTSILTGITLGEKKTSYFLNDEFVAPAVTASYRGKANTVVTAEFSGYDMTETGEQTVTASYTEGGVTKTATYDITVSDGTQYDIAISVNNGSMGSASATVGGQAATKARAGEEVKVTITPNTGYVFSSLTLNGEDKTAEVSANVFTFTMPAAEASISIVFQEPQDEIYFYESFNSCTGSGGNDGQWSGSIASNNLTANNEGWIFANGNGADKCAKFGSGSKKGSAETPSIDVKTTTATLRFKAAAWNGNSEGTTLNVSATNATLVQSSVTLVKGSWTTYTVGVSNVTGEVKIKFEAVNTSNNRFFLDEVYVYYGAAPATPKENPTITATNKSITLSGGQATQNLSEMFDSNSTGSFTYSLKTASTTASIFGSTFTATAKGDYVIVANQAETDDYNADSAEATITVNEESQGDGDYEVDGTLASWTFTNGTAGTNYPSNSTNFNSNGGSDLASGTFYLNGSGSTWNSGAGKGYAFTAVTDVTITIKANKTLKAGAKVTLSMDTFYNKASNAPMTGFNITAKEGSGSFATTGLSVTSWSLSNSSANKSVVYTIQNNIAKDGTVSFKLTQTGKAGSGQGYISNIKAVYSAN